MAMSKLIGVFVITLLICSFFQAATTANVRTYRTMLKEILKEKSHENAPSPTYRVPAEILKEKPHENEPSLTYREPANPYTRGCSLITRCRGIIMAGLAGYIIYRLCTRSSTMRAAAAAQARPPEAATTGGFSGENLGTATPSAPPQPLHVAIFSSTCAICLNDIEDGERLLGFEGCAHMFHMLCLQDWLKAGNTCPLCGI
ncbi:hypothetical protein RJ639_030934 [Escallonia herrerae]|uniref:RING-type E3 ubiquitin transferase n=1 Tax=Escallonia herrerae TaxID=1293975 RepID=A0AA88X0K0_9ASTE|nr:hypothetical protein RJ639_030934 [Escallonia herrerae]